MVLRSLVAALLTGDTSVCNAIRDYLEEFHPNHPEAELYKHRLSDPTNLRFGTIWALCEKFGERREREWAGKARRRALKVGKGKRAGRVKKANTLKAMRVNRLFNHYGPTPQDNATGGNAVRKTTYTKP